MSQPNVSCLRCTFKNVSGEVKYFPFLPEHGHRLEPNEEISFYGEPVEAVAAPPGLRVRHIDAMESALLRGDITIVSSPNPILYDVARDETSILVVDGGTLATDTPCWLPRVSASASASASGSGSAGSGASVILSLDDAFQAGVLVCECARSEEEQQHHRKIDLAGVRTHCPSSSQ